MTTKMREWFTSAAALTAAGAGVVGVVSKIAIDVQPSEVMIPLVTAAVATVAGFYSLYIARAAKTLVKTERIFISYSREEKEAARELSAALLRRGAKVWIDENELQPGAALKAAVSTAIESSNTVVAVVSGSIGMHLRQELSAAVERHVPIFAVVRAGQRVSKELVDASEQVIMMGGQQDVERIASDVLAFRHGRDGRSS